MQYPEIRVDGEVVERLWVEPRKAWAEALIFWKEAYPDRVEITEAENIISLA